MPECFFSVMIQCSCSLAFQLKCLNRAALSLSFSVSRASLGSFLLLCSPGIFTEQTLVSTATKLPGTVAGLIRGCRGETPDGPGVLLSLQTYCSSMCSHGGPGGCCPLARAVLLAEQLVSDRSVLLGLWRRWSCKARIWVYE